MVSTARLGHILRRGGGTWQLLKSPSSVPGCGLRNAAVLYRLMSQAKRGDRVGPDRVLPANTLSTTWPDGQVEIRFSDLDPRCQEKPISVGLVSPSHQRHSQVFVSDLDDAQQHGQEKSQWNCHGCEEE